MNVAVSASVPILNIYIYMYMYTNNLTDVSITSHAMRQINES